MKPRIVCIVEGDGEVGAVRVVLRRLLAQHQRFEVEISEPIRVQRDRFLNKPDEQQRLLRLANAKADGGLVLILLDADDDCPVELAKRVKESARQWVTQADLQVVIANREFEAWFLAAARSLAGQRGLASDLAPPSNPDSIRNAKGWLGERMTGASYRPTSDQPALAATFDMEAAKASRSFRKFLSVIEGALSASSPA
jgi:hypothetical protein